MALRLGRQCRRPAPLAPCSRAQAPRAGGLGAAFRFGWGGEGVDGGRPTSRGLPPAGRWSTLPCPLGKGRCRCAGSTLFALRAKALQSGAPDHGMSRERAGFSERFAHQGNLPARRGTGERAAPRRGRRYTPSRGQNAPFSRQNLPHHPTAANAALYKARLMPVAENLPGARPRPAFRACIRPIRACLRPIRACIRPIRACIRPIRACLRPIRACIRPIRACLRPIPYHLRPSHTFCGRPMSLAAVPCLLLPIRAFMAFCAICGAFPALYDFPTPAYGPSAPFAAHPRHLRPIRVFCGHPALV